jgi:alpha-D-xyloside xylohydrolase
MILRSCLFLFFLPIYTFSQDYKGYILEKNRVEILLQDGKLNIIPLADEIIRVQWIKENIQEEQELILIHQPAVPKFKFTESIQLLVIKTAGVSVEFNKQTGAITYKDNKGEVFLKETAGSRVL